VRRAEMKNERGAVPANTLVWVLAVVGIVLLILLLADKL